ncbi:hypothetical protein V8B55DRAFT_1522990 [Mucor lusitanicus]|uniref:DUF1748-domain-containing protein n=2 Tax=Mucor circinelloides f. lusitanicus TaxID=29924 RepID=A0A162TD87_MUCCL|nr:DUF1748-domain-containing protein [Mucor lusitanicus]OAD03712.1 hypothetical protein MUCCIDRAFT_142280 [Mucor lusitanicus CBS 277.49]
MSKILHYAFDAVLITTVLAGIKRSTGLQPATSKIESSTIRGYFDQYLGFGEWVFDMSVAYLNHSSYFTKNNKRD